MAHISIRQLAVAGAVALATLPGSALAVPMCDPTFYGFKDRFGNTLETEQDAAARVEMQLRAHGIDARDSRFWNGCLQTFVREGGRTVMKFYDPDTLREIPVNE
jgi:hypothetical protein